MNTTNVLNRPKTENESARNMKVEEYDLVIIGSGAGSKLAAWTFAEQGQRVAVIELLKRADS
jgi:succinate dehydrogenase/fumarate reductase flavoprotein subunit